MMDNSGTQKLRILTAFQNKFKLRYNVVQPLGQGAYGFTYRAEDVRRNIDVCVKLFWGGLPAPGAARDWKITSTIKHDFVNSTHTVEDFPITTGEPDGLAVISSFVPGKDLRTVLIDNSPGEVQDDLFQNMSLDLVDSLRVIHASGHGHGDFHDQNIIVTVKQIHHRGQMKPVVIDFDNATHGGLRESATEVDLKRADLMSAQNIIGRITHGAHWHAAIQDILSKADTAESMYWALSALIKISPSPDIIPNKIFGIPHWIECVRLPLMQGRNPCFRLIPSFTEQFAKHYGQEADLIQAKKLHVDRIRTDKTYLTMTGTAYSSLDPLEKLKAKIMNPDDEE